MESKLAARSGALLSALTAVAFVLFARLRPAFAVIECGLGGRLESTNVIKTPVLSIITGIDLDHTSLLGATTAEMERAEDLGGGTAVRHGLFHQRPDDLGLALLQVFGYFGINAHGSFLLE